MRTWFCFGLLALDVLLAHAQSLDVTFSIATSQDTLRISPHIYGGNELTVNPATRLTARRLGGNRMTGYNWENNASNAGSDYNHSSDEYMTWIFGIPSSRANTPGLTLTTFHDTSLAHSCYSLLTLPAAGYVARDKNGTVQTSQSAPSFRWRTVRNVKGAPFVLTPDTADAYVNVDEEVNFLVSRYGPASGLTGVRGYAIDNEPALWPSTHPRIHPDTTRCTELIARITAGAKAVKSVDNSAEVFGGVFYGFGEYYHLQWAPDWNRYAAYENFAAALLANLRDSSTTAGRRLLDVLDIHWYPDLNVPIINENTDSLTVFNRMQVPRTLWDSTYTENGWIGQYYHPQSSALLRRTQRIIAQQYPGTKLALTEFNYGGSTHISGAIAMTDVLGAFGANGVYLATLWGDITGYTASAYRMYRNYDGAGGTFGDLSVHAITSDKASSAVYASTAGGEQGQLHIIALNRNFTHPLNAHFVINAGTQYSSGTAYAVLAGSTAIQTQAGTGPIQGNQFSYTIPPLSVFHFVFSRATGVATDQSYPQKFAFEQNYPNPFNPSTDLRFDLPEPATVSLAVYDVLGRKVAELVSGHRNAGHHVVVWDASGQSSGVYFARFTAVNQEKKTEHLQLRKLMLLK
jgi:mannan endo-1,4-beta-mannosidase